MEIFELKSPKCSEPYRLGVKNGQIAYASARYIGYHALEPVDFLPACISWELVRKILKLFLNREPKTFHQIVTLLDENTESYNIANEIIRQK